MKVKKTRQGIRLGSLLITVDIEHWLFVTFLYGICLAYYIDARSVSLHIQNLLLLTPLFVVISILYFGITLQSFRFHWQPENSADTSPSDQSFSSDSKATGEISSPANIFRSLGLILLFTVFIFAIPYTGFDIASIVFIILTLLWLGERNIIAILLFSILFPLVVTLFFKFLLPYPLPTLFL